MKRKINKLEKFNPSTRKEVSKIARDIKNGKNLSPRFSNSDEATKWLNESSKQGK